MVLIGVYDDIDYYYYYKETISYTRQKAGIRHGKLRKHTRFGQEKKKWEINQEGGGCDWRKIHLLSDAGIHLESNWTLCLPVSLEINRKRHGKVHALQCYHLFHCLPFGLFAHEWTLHIFPTSRILSWELNSEKFSFLEELFIVWNWYEL